MYRRDKVSEGKEKHKFVPKNIVRTSSLLNAGRLLKQHGDLY